QHRRQTGRQGATRHDVLSRNLHSLAGIEILHIPGEKVHGSDRNARLPGIEQVEIDELMQRRSERRCVVKTDGLGRRRRHKRGWRHARLEETRHAGRGYERRARLIEKLARIVVASQRRDDEAAGYEIPELPQTFDAALRWISRNDRSIE